MFEKNTNILAYRGVTFSFFTKRKFSLVVRPESKLWTSSFEIVRLMRQRLIPSTNIAAPNTITMGPITFRSELHSYKKRQGVHTVRHGGHRLLMSSSTIDKMFEIYISFENRFGICIFFKNKVCNEKNVSNSDAFISVGIHFTYNLKVPAERS